MNQMGNVTSYQNLSDNDLEKNKTIAIISLTT